MKRSLSHSPADPIRAAALPFLADPRSLDPLLDWMGEASIVLIGEGSYGTHEFQQARISLTRRLIEERGFTAVALDTDWQLARPVNRFVRGRGRTTEAAEALASLGTYPSWRWKNADMLDFIGWLRTHNDALDPTRQTGIYGLNLFGIDSIREQSLTLLDRVAPLSAARLRERSSMPPGIAAYLPMEMNAAVKEQLIARLLRHHHALVEAVMQQREVDTDDYFFLVENARQSRSAEDYYRSLYLDEMSIWQIRATHAANLLDALLEHKERLGSAKIVIWTHNVLAGDNRAVEDPANSGLSLGQAMRERHIAETYLIGQTTDHGTVAAASGWDFPVERCRLPEAPPGSVEALFHQSGLPRLLLNLQGDDDAVEQLREPMQERIPGAILSGEVPMISVRLADQFDAVLHFDETRALESI